MRISKHECHPAWYTISVSSLMIFFASMLLGCTGSESADEKTHFDHDHAVPHHWPADLPDAAAKIRVRLALPVGERDEATMRQLDELVAWVPEVSADTDLTEAQWLPIYTAAESLRQSVQEAGWDSLQDAQAEELCQLLDHAATLLPEGPQHADAPEVDS